jgi:predicted transcriptional regulator
MLRVEREDASMESHTIRVNKQTLDMVRELAGKRETTMTAIVEAAIREYRAAQFWGEVDAGYAALRADSEAWAEYDEEMRAWDGTLADGLEAFPYEGEK